jgi:hypothetical protein
MVRKLIAGRRITCNCCAHKTVKGQARVRRKVLFFFCPDCWFGKREKCNTLMVKVTA